ncbi:hypothetical protein [Kibdelosporangium phytohabitans]|uniref:vWA-MoxR associated protein middle region 2 domain-containing protein n=1 Tax=Kibdelosporangium phytohabitans TaxID=860235 RepID=A0A0N7F305_9PSEU|nr:hypothetical protein [Kibdelosporangium phytohabitans]ALG07287.1 hypothetical protein AOZ06_10450 [Kibdelosporangium phytohabitans]MBE1471850.1 hypothetical protein [Kibdelosporangium phytohabitans]
MATLFYPVGIPDAPGLPSLTQVDTAIGKLTGYVRDSFGDARIMDGCARWDHSTVTNLLDHDLPRASPQDTVVLYWSGHGQAGQGSHRLLLAEGRIRARDLTDALLTCPARTVLCVLDCCWSGDAVADIVQEASEMWKQWGVPAREGQTTTVIASARSERALEGAFVEAMLEVLTNGPGSRVGHEHRWDADEERVTPAQLVEGVKAWFDDAGLDQQAFSVNLRHSDVGRFFPSAWHTRTRELTTDSVDERSRARQQAVEVLGRHGIALPPAWTGKALEAHGIVVAGTRGLDEYERAFLGEVIGSLRLALSAQKLALTLIARTSFTEPALRSARRAVTKFDDSPINRQFDLFHDIARKRAFQSATSPVEALIRFIARLAYECGTDPHDSRMYDWAASHGVESHEVNRILTEVSEYSPIRRLVIDLVGDRSVEDELPDSASAQIFEDNTAVGDRIDVRITPASVATVLDAIAALVKDKRNEKFDRVDVVVPDRLVLLDPAAVALPGPRRSLRLAEKYMVSVRVGGRFHCAEDWSKLIEVYRTLTKDSESVWEIDASTDEDLFTALTNCPKAAVFGAVPGPADSRPPDHLLDAVYASPIVVWPAAEFDAETEVGALVKDHWPHIPSAVARARWRPPGSEQLSLLRHVWEDDEWLTLAKVIDDYG